MSGVRNWKFKSRPWEKEFENVENMIDDFQIIYHIMFGVIDNIHILYDLHIHTDLINIIAEYLFVPLPNEYEKLKSLVVRHNNDKGNERVTTNALITSNNNTFDNQYVQI
eukprot:207070_1